MRTIQLENDFQKQPTKPNPNQHALLPSGGAALGWEQLSLVACVGSNTLGSIFDIISELVSHGADKGITSSVKHTAQMVVTHSTTDKQQKKQMNQSNLVITV